MRTKGKKSQLSQYNHCNHFCLQLCHITSFSDFCIFTCACSTPLPYPTPHFPSHGVSMRGGDVTRLWLQVVSPVFSEYERSLCWLWFCHLKWYIFHTLWPLNASQPLHLVSAKRKVICCDAGGKTGSVGLNLYWEMVCCSSPWGVQVWYWKCMVFISYADFCLWPLN